MEVRTIELNNLNLNTATYIGIDAHTREHTALALNRFEEEVGRLTFDNTHQDIALFLSWIPEVTGKGGVLIGVEGGGTERHALLRALLQKHTEVYEINPLYTQQRRLLGTKGDKSDAKDAKLIASVLTRSLSELPKILPDQVAARRLILKKTVWFYEEITERQADIQHQIKQIKRELNLAERRAELRTLRFILKSKEKERENIQKNRKKIVKQFPKLIPKESANLATITGVSDILAAKLVAHTDGIERFKNIDKFIRYAGIAPVEKSSGKTKKFIKANKGNRKLNATFYMVALTQLRFDPRGQEYFAKKVAEGKTKKHAMRCLMKRVACKIYGMMKSGEAYRG